MNAVNYYLAKREKYGNEVSIFPNERREEKNQRFFYISLDPAPVCMKHTYVGGASSFSSRYASTPLGTFVKLGLGGSFSSSMIRNKN